MTKNFRIALLSIILAACAVAALAQRGGPRVAVEETHPPSPNVAEQYLQEAADRERAGLGLPLLRRDAALAAAARAHAMEMVRHNAISHQFSGEPDLAARGSSAGARFSLISENVAESPDAVKIHNAWMNSEGHRHNLLDPAVDAVGIAVVARGGQLFAVEDFAHRLEPLTLAQQEKAVATVIGGTGTTVVEADAVARGICSGAGSHSAARQPAFTVRYTTANLEQIPEELRSRLARGEYASAVVAACPAEGGGDFTMYRLAVLLYR